jgi:murein L,D-transpeptidase YafK
MYFRNVILLLMFISFGLFSNAQSFKVLQQKAPRVKSAYSEKWKDIQSSLTKEGYIPGDFEMLIRVFKYEKKVELWLKPKNSTQFTLFKTYNICYYSGGLGPKRKQGDGQVPEGFYNIALFNPYSNYHLSLGLNYPNASDKIIGKTNLGGDIMIHGNCVSIGCIPITDTYIKEVYLLAVEAKNSGQNTIPVYIFPSKMDEDGMNYLSEKYSGNNELLAFWKNIKVGYDSFETNKQILKINTDKSGNYIFGK